MAMNALDVPKEAPWGLDAPFRPLPLPAFAPSGRVDDTPRVVVHPRPPRAGSGRAVRVLVAVGLNVGAVVGVLVTGVTLLAARNGIHPLVVQSGSMEPTISTGSLVLVERVDAPHIKVGDIMTVERPDHTRVTHRVVAIERNGMTALLTMKGDANEDPDPVPVPVQYAYRLVAQVPVVGRAVGWLATAPGGFLLGGLSILVTAPVTRLRRSGGRRRRGTDLVLCPSCASASKPIEVPDNPATPANPFLSWVGIVVEERLTHRRSDPASSVDDWTTRHAA
jgi:signal peptidase I